MCAWRHDRHRSRDVAPLPCGLPACLRRRRDHPRPTPPPRSRRRNARRVHANSTLLAPRRRDILGSGARTLHGSPHWRQGPVAFEASRISLTLHVQLPRRQLRKRQRIIVPHDLRILFRLRVQDHAIICPVRISSAQFRETIKLAYILRVHVHVAAARVMRIIVDNRVADVARYRRRNFVPERGRR
jgi:hypothetical protein